MRQLVLLCMLIGYVPCGLVLVKSLTCLKGNCQLISARRSTSFNSTFKKLDVPLPNIVYSKGGFDEEICSNYLNQTCYRFELTGTLAKNPKLSGRQQY